MKFYIDMHCDTLMQAYLKKEKTIYQLPDTMADVKRLYEIDCKAQFFAIFMPPITMKKQMGALFPEDDAYIRSLLEIYRNTLREHTDIFAAVRNVSELKENAAAGKLSGILTLEDGRAVDGKAEKLEWLYEEGIRLISLTWNHENCFGAPNSADKETMSRGLTAFGREAVERMNELGMLIDVSHLSDGGFWDVAEITKSPFVASHSNCRALSPHPRNMTDAMIRELAEKGGVMGLNFSGKFLNEDIENAKSRIEHMIRHLKHMTNIGGINVAAIGTDFDGIKGEFEIGNCSEMQRLFDALQKAGFHESQIEQIAYKNIERVLEDVL